LIKTLDVTDALDVIQGKGLDALVKEDISTHLQLCNNYFSMHFSLKASKNAL
jgi:hypothetical protein